MSSTNFIDKASLKHYGPGALGGSSIILVLLTTIGGVGNDINIEEIVMAEEFTHLNNQMNDHLLAIEPHPILNQQLENIGIKLHDIEKELEDREKQIDEMKESNNNLIIQMMNSENQKMEELHKQYSQLKLIICSNPDYRCNISLNE